MFQPVFRFIVTNVINRVRVSLCSVTEELHFGGAIPSNKPSHIQDCSRSSCLLLVPATQATAGARGGWQKGRTRHRTSLSLLVLTPFYFRSSQIMRIIYIIT